MGSEFVPPFCEAGSVGTVKPKLGRFAGRPATLGKSLQTKFDRAIRSGCVPGPCLVHSRRCRSVRLGSATGDGPKVGPDGLIFRRHGEF